MANLVIPRREIWTSQPTEFVPLANWIKKGQSRVFNPAFGAVDVATGKPLTLVGANPLISPVSAGLAFDTNAAACRYEIPLLAGDGVYQAKQYIVFAQFELTFVGSGPYGGQVVELSAGYGKQIYIGASPSYTQSKRVACFIRPNNQTQNYVRTLDAGSNTEIVTVAIFCKTGFSPEFFAKGDGWTDYYKLPTAITNAADTFDKLTFCGSSYDAIDLSYARKITLGGVLAQPDVSAAMARDLVQNPWQIFAPRTTYLFSVTALANTISLGLVAAQFSAQAYQPSADTTLGSGAAGVGANSVSPAGVLSTNTAVLPVTSQGAFVSAVQSLQSANVSLNSPDLDYILGALGNAVSLGLASISTTARAITYSTPGGTVHVVPYEFIGDYDIVHCSGNIAVDRSGALIIILR